MMWTRFELKERAKQPFRRNYWRSVLVAFILMLFVSGGGSAVSNSWNQITSSGTSDDSYYTEYFDDGDIGHFYYNSGTSIPRYAGKWNHRSCRRWCHDRQCFTWDFPFQSSGSRWLPFLYGNSEYQPTVGRLGFALSEGHVRKNRIDFIFTETFYWSVESLLLIVPGIVKAYEYRMVPLPSGR